MGKFTQEEFIEVLALVNSIGDFIDTNKVHPLWEAYCKVTDGGGAPPCTCNPRKWQEIVTTLREYITTNNL
jgi:hypothetical protein